MNVTDAALGGNDRDAHRRRQRNATLVDLGATIATIVLALLIGFLATWMVGKDPVEAFRALLTGPLTRSLRIGRWIEDATTIILLGLSVSIPFRAGQVSLGAEGQVYAGALAAGAVAVKVPLPPVLSWLVPMAAAALVGYLLGLGPGTMKARWGANEIVSTLMLNAVIVRVYAWILTSFLMARGATIVASEYMPHDSRLTRLSGWFGHDLGRANVGVLLIPLVVLLVWFLLTRTPYGYEVRMVGANANFATYGGVSSERVVATTYAVGGAIAGLVGAHLVMGTNNRLILSISAGLGFEGIVVAILARNNPLVIPIAGAAYSYLRVGGEVMEQQASVGTEIVQIIQATIILLITAQVAHTVLRRYRTKRLVAGAPA